MDRVRILLQRDLAYYQAHQTVLQENLCPGIVGGLLDFPHYASFAAVKMVCVLCSVCSGLPYVNRVWKI
jgi:hypothetical protein